jgi:hypothetical protein
MFDGKNLGCMNQRNTTNTEMVQGTPYILLNKPTPRGKKRLTEETGRWRKVLKAIGRILGETAE